MKNQLAIAAIAALLSASYSFAQNSAPAPRSPGATYAPPPANYPGPVPGPPWGSPWNSGWNAPPPPPSPPTDYGFTTVTACGYDAQGIWRVIPLYVNYNYTGVQYDVVVVNAYNPWTDSWDDGVDMPAYNTNYYINGNTFDFYTSLSTGTYYFDL